MVKDLAGKVEAAEAKSAADWADYAARDGVCAVVLADPTTVALLSAFDRHVLAANEAAAAIRVVDDGWQLANESWLAALPPETERLLQFVRSGAQSTLIANAGLAGAEPWRDTVARLAEEADAVLPAV